MPERTNTTDPVTVEVLANMFRAVVDEMAWVLLRSSHTTFVKETQDFSTGLVTLEGEMFAAPHTKGATPLMGIPMDAGTRAFDDWAPGDVLVTNDPYATNGMVMHANDLYVFQPIFEGDRLVCFAWAFIHCTDVGGAVPGSIDMKHVEVHQEGIRLRPMKLFRKGQLDENIWHIFADNCRIPDLNWGDVSALLSALQTGERRVRDLVVRYGIAVVVDTMYQTLDNTERLTRQTLARIPAGEYSFVEYFEDDYTSRLPVRIQMQMTARGDGTVELDFTGSDPQVRAAINLPAGGHKHHPFLCLALVNFVATHAEGLHLNAGILRCIDLVLPENSVVNASYPAACGMRYTTACRIHEVVLGALNQAVPDLVPSGGSSHAVITYISTSESGQGRVVVANPVQGGSGAGLGLDGEAGIDFPAAFLRNVPVEVLESEVPVTVHRLQLRPGTEGAGRLRGGFGLEYALEVRHPSAVVIMRGKDRHRFSSFGADGGQAGATAGCTVTRRDGTVVDVDKETVYVPRMGDVIMIRTGGGGGKGSPIDRSPEAVAIDVADGLIDAERAEDVYGVVLRDGVVDTEETRQRRASMRSGSGFDVGPGRAEWEKTYGGVADRITEWLTTLDAAVRRSAQAAFYETVDDVDLHDPEAVANSFTAVEERLALSTANRR